MAMPVLFFQLIAWGIYGSWVLEVIDEVRVEALLQDRILQGSLSLRGTPRQVYRISLRVKEESAGGKRVRPQVLSSLLHGAGDEGRRVITVNHDSKC